MPGRKRAASPSSSDDSDGSSSDVSSQGKDRRGTYFKYPWKRYRRTAAESSDETLGEIAKVLRNAVPSCTPTTAASQDPALKQLFSVVVAKVEETNQVFKLAPYRRDQYFPPADEQHAHPLQQHTRSVPMGLLATGISFPEVVRWHPLSFAEPPPQKAKSTGKKEDAAQRAPPKDPFRPLLVAGGRIPKTYTCKVSPQGKRFHLEEPERKRMDVARFSRIVQVWYCAVPPSPSAYANATDDAGATGGAGSGGGANAEEGDDGEKKPTTYTPNPPECCKKGPATFVLMIDKEGDQTGANGTVKVEKDGTAEEAANASGGGAEADGKAAADAPKLTESDYWRLMDVQWFAAGCPEFVHAYLRQAFSPADPDLNRLGIIAMVTSAGHLAVYALPYLVAMHVKARPFLQVQDRTHLTYTTVQWHVRKGKTTLFCGMITGDIAWAHILTDRRHDKPVLMIAAHIRGHAHGMVKELRLMQMWGADTQGAVGGYESDSDCDQEHDLPVCVWGPRSVVPPRTKAKVRGNIPVAATVEERLCLVSLGSGDKHLRVWDVDLLPACTAHGSINVLRLANSSPTTLSIAPCGVLMTGCDNGTITTHAFPGEPWGSSRSDATTPSLYLKASFELQSSICSMAHGTCNRREGRALQVRRGNFKGEPPLHADTLLAHAHTNGIVALLRMAKRMLTPKAGKVRCPVCRRRGFKNSLMLAQCACQSKEKTAFANVPMHMNLVEETNLLLVKNVVWVPPAEDGKPMSVQLTLSPSPKQATVKEYRDQTGMLIQLVNQCNQYTVDLASNKGHAHMLAVGGPGGLIYVISL